MPRKTRGQTLTPHEIDEIVRLRLNNVGIREVAATVNVDLKTVTKYWHAYLDEVGPQRKAELETHRTSTIMRLERLAERAAIEAAAAETISDRAKCLQIERQAMTDLSRICGFDAPKQVQIAGTVVPTEAEALKYLADLEREGLPVPNGPKSKAKK